MSLPVKRYANALYRAAEEKGQLDAVAGDLKALHEVLQDAEIQAVLNNPAAPARLCRALLEKATANCHELVQNFASVVQRRRRGDVLPEVWPAFHALLRKARGEVEGVVETARPLGPGDLETLQKMADSLTGSKVELSVVENPDLIGGVRLRVGNTLYDGSVAHSLEQLHKQLMAAPLPGAS